MQMGQTLSSFQTMLTRKKKKKTELSEQLEVFNTQAPVEAQSKCLIISGWCTYPMNELSFNK